VPFADIAGFAVKGGGFGRPPRLQAHCADRDPDASAISISRRWP
jgi:hypothetical protein